MPVTIYYDKDADLNILKSKKIGVLGYGSQGHAHAQNLRDSGMNVTVAELAGTENHKLAIQHKFNPISVAEATQSCDLLLMTLPDEVQPKIYKSEIATNIKAGQTLGFTHGFNIHFGQIVPPDGVDVIMIAPKCPGHLVRSEFTRGGGVPCLVAIEKNHSGKALQIGLAWGCGIGGGRAGILETSFKDETETDLFGEQVVLCGGVTALVKAAFETLLEAGYPPEICYFECMHELKLIVDLIYEGGLSNMYYSVSNTAQYGGLSRGKRIIGDEAREEMERILEDVKNGTFAREWILENQAVLPVFRALTRAMDTHLVEDTGKELRRMMPWIEKHKKVDRERN